MKHSHGLAIPTTLQDVCDPQRMALIVYDMQVGICRPRTPSVSTIWFER
jgi:biuret amidohydrolase